MTRAALAILVAAWLVSGAPGFQWLTRAGCDVAPVVVTDAPAAFASCEWGQAVVTVKGRASYVYLDGVKVIDNRVWLVEVMR